MPAASSRISGAEPALPATAGFLAGPAGELRPVEIVREGPVTIARYPGGRHANGSFPVFAGNGIAEIHAQLSGAMRRQRPDVDLVLLERNEQDRDGRTNPLLKQGCHLSPNVALAVDLAGGWLASRLGIDVLRADVHRMVVL